MRPSIGLGIGVLTVSFAAVLIRLTEPAPPLTVAAYRMALSVLLLMPVIFWRYRAALKAISFRNRLLAILAGFFLGVHFATWISSLRYTTIASAVVLVNTHSIFVAILSALALREKLSFQEMAGIGIAFAGSVAISSGDLNLGKGYLLGDCLALVGAVMAAFYMLFGRHVRQQVGTLPYVFLTYSTASLTLLFACFFSHSPLFPYPPQIYLWFFLLALVPTIIGHTLLNWALRFVPAYAVAVCILGEPVAATLWAYLIFHEIPRITVYWGGALIFTGVYLTLSNKDL